MNFDCEPSFTHPNRTAKKPKKHPERDLQVECVNWFRSNYRNCLIWSTPNEAAATRATLFRQLGMLKGVSDIVVAMPNRILFIEFKSDDGCQSREQKTFEQKITRLGFDYYVIRDFTTFKNVIQNKE